MFLFFQNLSSPVSQRHKNPTILSEDVSLSSLDSSTVTTMPFVPRTSPVSDLSTISEEDMFEAISTLPPEPVSTPRSPRVGVYFDPFLIPRSPYRRRDDSTVPVYSSKASTLPTVGSPSVTCCPCVSSLDHSHAVQLANQSKSSSVSCKYLFVVVNFLLLCSYCI